MYGYTWLAGWLSYPLQAKFFSLAALLGLWPPLLHCDGGRFCEIGMVRIHNIGHICSPK